MATPAKYRHINLTPPKGVQEAARSFLDAVERGEGGDGLEGVTIREARAVARGEAITWFKADKLMRFWTRSERFLDAEKGSPAWTSALGWFGRPGFEWASKLRRQKKAADGVESCDIIPSASLMMSDPGDPMRLFKAGSRIRHKKHPEGGFNVDDDFVSNLLDSFRKARANGYAPPILAEHQRRGFSFGVLDKLEIDDGYVVAIPHYADGVEDEVRAGRRPYVSPTIYFDFEDPHTGEIYPVFLAEVSFVAVPLIKNLDQRVGGHYAFAEDTDHTHNTGGFAMSDEKGGAEAPVENEENEATMSPEQMAVAMREMATRLAELERVVGELANAGDDVEASEDEEGEEVSMAEQVADLRRQLETERNMRAISARLPDAEEQLVADLAILMSDDVDRAERFISMAETRAQTTTVQAPIGQPGTAPEGRGEELDADAMYEKAREACAPGADTRTVVAKMGEMFPEAKGAVLLL